MGLLLRGGRFLGADGDGTADVAIDGDRIRAVGRGLEPEPGDRVLECHGRIVCAGFVDLWARVGEPGFEFREDIDSAARAAAAGGFVAVCAVPDSRPVNDTRAVTDLLLARAKDAGGSHIWPMAALTAKLGSERLAELGELADAGVVAACTADAWLADSGLMRRGLEYARTFDLPVVVKPFDGTLAHGGVAHEGPRSTRLGLAGIPEAAESAALARDLELAALTGARLVVSHLSAARSVELVAQAKARGLDVVATVSANHLALCEDDCEPYDPAAKLVPPLRTAADRRALRRGLADGTIDCVVSDHDPKAVVDKEHELADAEPGAVGLQTAASVVWQLVAANELSAERAIDVLARAPRRALGRGDGIVREGAPADLCVFDGDATWVVDSGSLCSKSKSTPLLGKTMVGRAMTTIVAGRVVFDAEVSRV